MMKLTAMQMKSVQVDLGPRSYSVLIGMGDLKRAGAVFRENQLGGTNAFVLTNKDVGALYFQTLHDALMLTLHHGGPFGMSLHHVFDDGLAL